MSFLLRVSKRALILPVASFSAHSFTSYVLAAEQPKLSYDDLKATLAKGLSEYRNDKSPNRKKYPELIVRLDVVGEQKKKAHSIEVPLTKYSNNFGILSTWLEAMSSDKIEIHSVLDSGDGGRLICFVSGDGRASIVARSSPKTSLAIFKDGGFTPTDAQKVIEGYKLAFTPTKPEAKGSSLPPGFWDFSDLEAELPQRRNSRPSAPSPIDELQSLGIRVYERDPARPLTWQHLAGYENVKCIIQESIINALRYPDLYDQIAGKTRESFESNRPKAVLLEGPPGTGKTLTARIIAEQCDRPMIHLAIENIVSKWYGDSEKKLAQIFDACEKLGDVVIFIDEIDAMVSTRAGDMHEATRRILSVILQRLEGFQGRGKSILICATNRPQDLDAALLSRFDVSITYDLPDTDTRKAVFQRYAKHLSRISLHELAENSEGMSCRDIKDVCEHAERKYASELITKNKTQNAGMPSSKDYMDCLLIRKNSIIGGSNTRPSKETHV